MFDFPKIQREPDFKYENNLLKSATFQLKYPRNQDILEKEDDIKERLSNFPNIKPIVENQAKVKFEFGKNKTPILESSHSVESGYEFRTSDNQKVVNITPDSLTYTIFGPAYINFDNVCREMNETFLPL